MKNTVNMDALKAYGHSSSQGQEAQIQELC